MGPEAVARLHAVVRGEVQGVGFRYFVRDRALTAGLEGWVRNLADGGVECLAQGPRDRLEELARELHAGPQWATVSDVRVEWQEPRPDLSGFRVTG